MTDVIGWRSELAERLLSGPAGVSRTAICALKPEFGKRCTFAPTDSCRCGIRVVKRLDFAIFALTGLRDQYPQSGDLAKLGWPQFGPRTALVAVRGSGTILPGRGDPPETVRCEHIDGTSSIAYLIDGYQDPRLEPELTECGWTVRWLYRPRGDLGAVPVEWVQQR